jgi:hypothetical protein
LTANTGTPAAAMAAAAWSWVEKMLHDAQRTSAPRAVRVSISTAVWMVMCSEPVMRAPCSGLGSGEFFANRHQARHFGFGDAHFLAAPVGEAEVGNHVVLSLVKASDTVRLLENCDRDRKCGSVLAEGLQPGPTQLPMPGMGWLDERRLRNPSLKLSDDSPAALLGLGLPL